MKTKWSVSGRPKTDLSLEDVPHGSVFEFHQRNKPVPLFIGLRVENSVMYGYDYTGINVKWTVGLDAICVTRIFSKVELS